MFYCLFCGAEAHSWKDLRAHQAACPQSAGITPRPATSRSRRVQIAREVVEHVLTKVLPTISDFSRAAAKVAAKATARTAANSAEKSAEKSAVKSAGYKPFENIDELLNMKGEKNDSRIYSR